MFDWFREVGEELSGIDSKEAKKQRQEKKELKKLNRFIFTKGMKILVIFLGVLYLVSTGSVMFALKNSDISIGYVIKAVVFSLIDFVILFALIFGKKKGEIVAIIGIFIFVVGLFLSTMLM